jgi:hypothetical protein
MCGCDEQRKNAKNELSIHGFQPLLARRWANTHLISSGSVKAHCQQL